MYMHARAGWLCSADGHACGQDGYAVLASDGPGDYDVAFEVFAGTATAELQPGTVAYIGTGGAHGPLMATKLVPWGYRIPPALKFTLFYLFWTTVGFRLETCTYYYYYHYCRIGQMYAQGFQGTNLVPETGKLLLWITLYSYAMCVPQDEKRQKTLMTQRGCVHVEKLPKMRHQSL
jgi:hypothetical protein